MCQQYAGGARGRGAGRSLGQAGWCLLRLCIQLRKNAEVADVVDISVQKVKIFGMVVAVPVGFYYTDIITDFYALQAFFLTGYKDSFNLLFFL